MGNKNSVFSEEQLDNYVDATFLTKTEVLRVFKRFQDISGQKDNKELTFEDLQHIRIKYSELSRCPELKENPFRKRICKVFSADYPNDDVENKGLDFNEFLMLYSVFSDNAPREIKVHYAFQIYDFDGDNYINASDIELAAKLLTQNELCVQEIKEIVESVLIEGDIDDDKKLSPNEFEHVITKSPDFFNIFSL
ncbi:calcium and integrin-binding family member 2 [Lepeophtheirus salmonis]|uniref:calcium and integrin-binding family member 2 n=1 Tax=Lepeophtheirus salmonis TaxID=72036 RepID=UPI001AE2BAA5|nr:calcium and integrin-binding family member 2-like [Lepeophtheirus salmonis]